ncbi:hypothetical protein LMI01_17960 [Companilactobacillus mindensis]|nr:hypothetical protein LMI01_17960 [Companilactobacillus mindensis]
MIKDAKAEKNMNGTIIKIKKLPSRIGPTKISKPILKMTNKMNPITNGLLNIFFITVPFNCFELNLYSNINNLFIDDIYNCS